MTDNDPKSPADNPFTNFKLPLGVRLFLFSARLLFTLLGQVSPRLAGNIALRFFMTPPNFAMPRREQASSDAAELRFQAIDGETIAVRAWGEGPTILLSHGWGGRGTQFFAFIEPLAAAGYRVVAFDAPAHGDSSGKRTNMLKVSRTAAAVAKQEGPIKALICHSFGCGTALLAIDRLALSAEKVILFSCFSDILWITERFAEAFAMNERSTAAMREEAHRRYGDAFDTPWQWPQLSPLNTIKQVAGDLLLIHDKQDTEVPYDHALKLIKSASGAELITTNRLGHRKILMNKKCIDACIDFINGSSPDRVGGKSKA
ncbi:MAG: alpha/beta hydrolase [Candidatus Thiodiazotropha sp. (ex Dulcina madagascariensis)]|nr:alpha/beta hydrolase [Candidatus Thiodiazotropha sp. (ex Dulcina madagascariensis)]